MKILKIAAWFIASIVAFLLSGNSIDIRNSNIRMSQDMQEVLNRNNLRLEHISCYEGEQDLSRLSSYSIPKGFCSFKATPEEIKNAIAKLNFKVTYINLFERSDYDKYLILNDKLKAYCLKNLNSNSSKIDAYGYGGYRHIDPFAFLELYYVSSSERACLAAKYLGSN